jgi:hypothetical protein
MHRSYSICTVCQPDLGKSKRHIRETKSHVAYTVLSNAEMDTQLKIPFWCYIYSPYWSFYQNPFTRSSIHLEKLFQGCNCKLCQKRFNLTLFEKLLNLLQQILPETKPNEMHSPKKLWLELEQPKCKKNLTISRCAEW